MKIPPLPPHTERKFPTKGDVSLILIDQISRQSPLEPSVVSCRHGCETRTEPSHLRRRENVNFHIEATTLLHSVYTYTRMSFSISFSIEPRTTFQHNLTLFSLRSRRGNYFLLLRWLFQVQREREFYLQMTDEREREREQSVLVFRKSRRFNRIRLKFCRAVASGGGGGGVGICVFLR